MGTLYYLAYGQTHAAFQGVDVLWAVSAFVIVLSVVVHGVAAKPITRRLERRGQHVVPGTPQDVSAGGRSAPSGVSV